MQSCRRLLVHTVRRADLRAAAKTGKRMAARIAITAITTRSSIRVNPALRLKSRPRGIIYCSLITAPVASELHRAAINLGNPNDSRTVSTTTRRQTGGRFTGTLQIVPESVAYAQILDCRPGQS